MAIPVVYEDEWLLVVDKPSGLLTIPTPKNEQRTLTSILNDGLKEKGISYRLHPCHRLDRETSGLIIYAKGKSVEKKMIQAFKDRSIKKSYLAFVRGVPKQACGEIKFSIEGKSALTKYRLIKKTGVFCVIKAHPLTGRTNQLRIHFKAIGHPILGESKYAFRKDFTVKAKRLCLHAQELEFTHPLTNKLIKLSLDLPQDMKKLLEKYV
jgi:23S rRNA pseudouridine1911/1915/1917 synthase